MKKVYTAATSPAQARPRPGWGISLAQLKGAKLQSRRQLTWQRSATGSPAWASANYMASPGP